MLRAIIISFLTGEVDFSDIKKQGIDYVILRSGFGRLARQKDTLFDQNYKAAKEAGLQVGTYWESFAFSPADARIEAHACLTCVKEKEFDLPVFFSMRKGSALTFGKEKCTDIAIAFCDELKNAEHEAGVFLNQGIDEKQITGKFSICKPCESNSQIMEIKRINEKPKPEKNGKKEKAKKSA